MLYVIQKGYNLVAPTLPENIVYCVSSLQKIIEQNLDFVFTDGHAVDSFSTQYTQTDIADINSILDRNAIKAKYWKDEDDLDLKRRKEAEFLVLGGIPPAAVLGYAVYNRAAQDKVLGFGVNEGIVPIKPNFYF